jgi:hypothetical protein
MYNAAACVVSDSVSSTKYGDLSNTVCGSTSCTGLNGNGTTGAYNAYSMCESKQKLAFALNKYYSERKEGGYCLQLGRFGHYQGHH